jgi:hypothetical protein
VEYVLPGRAVVLLSHTAAWCLAAILDEAGVPGRLRWDPIRSGPWWTPTPSRIRSA